MSRALTIGMLVLLALLGAGLGALALWHAQPIRTRFYTDADTIHAPVDRHQPRDVLWQPPTPLRDGELNSLAADYEPRVSADGALLFFVRGKAGQNADIFVCKRTPTGWSAPESLDEVNSPQDDLGPQPTADGNALYFYSNRPDGLGGYDLWVARRGADGRSAYLSAENLGPLVNSSFDDYGPALTPDGHTLYFASNRPQPGDARQPNPDAWPATLREDLYTRTYDLYVVDLLASGSDGEPRAARPLAALNTPANEGAPAVSPYGDFLYFASDRPGGQGGFDLWRSWRLRGEHRPAENLGPPVNTPANELDPALALGGFGLYFSSDRTARAGQSPTTQPAQRDYDVYYSAAREVFIETEQSSRPPLDWAAIWRNLLWALLALLLALALLAFLRDMRSRRLSLLTRCLLASILAHALFMLLLSLWRVSAALVNDLRRGAPRQVALESAALAGQIETQLTADLAGAELPAPATPITAAAEPALPPPQIDARVELPLPESAIRIQPPEFTAAPADAAPPPPAPHTPSATLADAPRAPDVALRLPDAKPPEPQSENALALTQVPRLDTAARPADAPIPTSQPALAAVRLDPGPVALTPPSLPELSAPTDASTATRSVALPLAAAAVPDPTAVPLALPQSNTPSAAAASPEPARSDLPPLPLTSAERADLALTLSSVTAPNAPLLNPAIAADSAAPKLPTLAAESPLRDAALPAAAAAPIPLAAAPVAAPADIALRLPVETIAPPFEHAPRAPEARKPLLERLGGSDETERAVAAALAWLARHQARDGRWDGTKFDRGCGQCDGAASNEVSVGLTGLSLLCFLAADHTHVKDGPYRDHVQRGLNWLLTGQGEDGDLRRNEETMYSHGIATIALAEALAMTRDPRLVEPVQRAADFILKAQHPRTGGWRYEPGEQGDTSVLGWQVMALKSAETAGAKIPPAAYDGARRWLALVADPRNPGRCAYRPGRGHTPAMTAEALFVRELLGVSADDEAVRGATRILLQRPPAADSQINTYYWYYATLALFQQQGDAWQDWNARLTATLLKSQRSNGPAAGSWDPEGEWADTGGRVYQTALCTLMLEVYYRYLPMYAANAAERNGE